MYIPVQRFSVLLLLRMINVYNLCNFSTVIEHVEMSKRMTRFFLRVLFCYYIQYREVYFIFIIKTVKNILMYCVQDWL